MKGHSVRQNPSPVEIDHSSVELELVWLRSHFYFLVVQLSAPLIALRNILSIKQVRAQCDDGSDVSYDESYNYNESYDDSAEDFAIDRPCSLARCFGRAS